MIIHARTNLVFVGLVFLGIVGSGTRCYADETSPTAHSESYMIRFSETGLLHYKGGVDGLVATSPSTSGTGVFDISSPEARAYGEYLERRRAEHLQAVSRKIGREPEVSHSYAITRNGVAAMLTADEAELVSLLTGIESVERSKVEYIQTHRGPAFIGAPAIWDGSATPNGIGTRGEGVVVGVIDTGAASNHPAFANDLSCGHTADAPKLISAVDCASSSGGICNGPNPEANAGNGHGVHVASTAVGNVLDASANPAPGLGDGQTMSGVAPCARLRSYKVCETESCNGAAILAAIENAIVDAVGVINYSISGGMDPWAANDFDRAFLDAVDSGILVAAAAGNTSAGVLNPIGKVNHLGPWVMAVAASSHDQNASVNGSLSVEGPGSVPAGLQTMTLTPAVDTDVGVHLNDAVVRFDSGNPRGCTSYGSGFFDDAIALIERGDCTYYDKVANAASAGAVITLIYNNEPGGFGIATGGASLPTYGIEQSIGLSLVQFIQASQPEETTADFNPALVIADMLASFSLRGPTSAAFKNLSKPDLTAPGINIYAAMDPMSDYGFMSGTSMASPHVAGAMALLRSAHPEWRPMEIKSALQTTAVVDGLKDNGVSSWDVDDVGNGRIDLTAAARAGLLLDESSANFLAANPSGGSLDLRQLNLPSMRDVQCTPGCTFIRAVTNRLKSTGTWTAGTVTAPDFYVSVSPATFTLTPGESQELTIVAAPANGAIMTEIGFGRIDLVEAESQSPPQHLTLAVKGEGRYDYIDIATASAVIADHCDVSGQSNGVAEPGETMGISVPLVVRGRDFSGVEATLLFPAPAGVTYLTSKAYVGDVSPGQDASAEFAIHIAEGNVCLDDFLLPIVFTSGPDEFHVQLPVNVGLTGDEMFLPGELPLPIPDGNAGGVSSQIEVLQSFTVDNLKVEVNVDHNWVGDLTIKLANPAGTEITLLDRPGYPASSFGCGNRQLKVTFSDGEIDPENTCTTGTGATWPVLNAGPTQPLSTFAGQITSGVWTLTVADEISGYVGRILNWRLVPNPSFEGICSVCSSESDEIFGDGFDWIVNQ